MNGLIRRALVSVSDKTGLAELAKFLAAEGVEILSTGGSAAALAQNGVAATEVSTATGFPEVLDGRVKTLHPAIHGGILAIRDCAQHQETLAEHGIAPIDLVVVNLYPFAATVARGAAFDECIENIDVGGPAMIRAAAKNHAFVTVLVDPEDYAPFMEEMRRNGGAPSQVFRRAMAAKAFALTAGYDAAIALRFEQEQNEPLPERVVIAGRRRQRLRYGENPHQPAAFYTTADNRPGVATARQIQGKELSYNNIADTDAALDLVAEFAEPAVAIIKHANPCGAARANTLVEAYRAAFACDPVSAFGGIIAVNRPLDRETAEEIAGLFVEVVIAPGIEEGAEAALREKKNLRLLLTDGLPQPAAPGLLFRSVNGGFLVQGRDVTPPEASWRVVSSRQPFNVEKADLAFAWTVCKHVKSNAIVFCKNGATVGIGAGQMSRLDSARLAASKAETARLAAGEIEARTRGSVVASDAFFPFPDGLIACSEAGATAVIQPGGSMRDEEVIAAANERGMTMIFTGVRHFRH